MAKVILLVSTHYGSPYNKGDIVDVPDRVSDRWVKNGIAQLLESEEGTPARDVVNYDRDFKAVELQQIAKEREIDGWDSMKKAELVTALQKHDADYLAAENERVANQTVVTDTNPDSDSDATETTAARRVANVTADDVADAFADSGDVEVVDGEATNTASTTTKTTTKKASR